MKIIKDSVIYLCGELAARSVPFLLLPYLSHKLGVEGFGELSYFQAWLALFTIFISLSQEGAISRYFYFYGKRSLNLVLQTGYIYSFTIGCLILLGCWIAKSEILAIVALSCLFQSFLSVQLTIRQCRKQAISYTIIQLCSTFISAGLTILFLEIFKDDLVQKRLLAILCSNITVFSLAYFLYSHKTQQKRFNLKQYKFAFFYLVGFGLPLILHNSSLFLRGQFDRFLINHQFNQAELGLYAMGLQIAAILTIIIQVLNKALTPYLFEGLKQGLIKLNHIHKWTIYSFIFIPFPALLMWTIPESWVSWVLGEQFYGTKHYIILFLVSSALLIPYLILVNYLYYFGKNKQIAFCSIISTLLYLISLLWLIQTQVQYIPFSSIIGSLSILPMLYFMTKKVIL